MFGSCKKLTSLSIPGWDISKATTLEGMFYETEKLTSLDMSNWICSPDNGITNIGGMFMMTGVSSLDLTAIKTPNVTNFSGVFSWSSNLTSVDISTWDFSKCTDFGPFFTGTGLTSIRIPHYSGNLENTTTKLYGSTSSKYVSAPGTATFTLVD